jgi:3-dehydroquinate synthase
LVNEARTLEQGFSVAHRYPVVFGRSLVGSPEFDAVFARFGEQRHRAFALLDAGLVEHWPNLSARLERAGAESQRWELVTKPVVLPGGEAVKNDSGLVAGLHARFYELGLDRHSFVLAIGGGALLDAVGFAAATAHRGIRLIRFPTTVLSQNDGGVGVKNGVNAFESKNFLGTFVPPAAVLNDFDFLKTLSPRDRAAGMAEAVKVGLIRDGAFFTWLEAHSAELAEFRDAEVEYLVERTAELHLEHIRNSGDAFELGSARPLDFGHWAAHKLESLTHHALRHGEAVAIGMAMDALYSAARGMISERDAERVCTLLERLRLPVYHAALTLRNAPGELSVLAGLEEFRQHLGGRLSVTLLSALGAAVQADAIDAQLVAAQIEKLRARSPE